MPAPPVSGFQVIVRAVPGTNPLEPVEDAIRQIDANLSSFSPASVAEAVERMSEVTRRSVLMYAGIGVFGLVIVAVGLAGVTAFTVVHRAKEIAIRIALGASGPGIVVLVMKRAFLIVDMGLSSVSCLRSGSSAALNRRSTRSSQ